MIGIIIINNGRLILKLENNKNYELNIDLPNRISWEDIEDMEVYDDEYNIRNGYVEWIMIKDKKCYNNSFGGRGGNDNRAPKKQARQNAEPGFLLNIPATSPYNFVPLNNAAIVAEEGIEFDEYDSNRHTGYIDITIDTLTPVFIRGENENFFKMNGRDAIPGSSIRGLIRTMVEVLSFGKFETFDDTKYFMRFIADKKGRSYKSHYYSKMGLSEEGTTAVTHNAKAGFLIYNPGDFSYAILPALGNVDDILHKPGQDFSHHYDPVKKGWNVFSGNMKKDGKDKKQWFFPETFINNPKKISGKIIEDYIADKNRNIDLDLLKLSRNEIGANKKYKTGVPIFYTEENDKISSFGHTKNYRIPYDKYTGNLVPDTTSSIDGPDIAERIFGDAKKNEISGRVFFEDAILTELKGNYLYKMPQILSGPKPTSFQLYLEQNGSDKSYIINDRDHVHWDTKDARIRGYKFYWHRDATRDDGYVWFDKSYDAGNPNANKNSTQSSRINAIPQGNTFKGRIRFENLTDIELGAILTAIELPGTKNGCHKIGMGKPLGLGTVKFTAALFLSNREKRYNTLFSKDGKWEEPLIEKEQMPDVKKSFAHFLLREIDKSKTSIWDIDRLAHLKTMLEFDGNKMADKEWLEKTRYMKIKNESGKNEFRERNVLPNPTEVNELYLGAKKK